MNAPNQWELCAWRLVAQLALQGLPQWQGQDLLTFNAAVRELWTLECKPRNPDPFMTRCESFFSTLRKHVPIGKLAEFDHLMQLAVRFRDRVPPDDCPIGASDEQIRSLARMIDLNGVKGGEDE